MINPKKRNFELQSTVDSRPTLYLRVRCVVVCENRSYSLGAGGNRDPAAADAELSTQNVKGANRRQRQESSFPPNFVSVVPISDLWTDSPSTSARRRPIPKKFAGSSVSRKRRTGCVYHFIVEVLGKSSFFGMCRELSPIWPLQREHKWGRQDSLR